MNEADELKLLKTKMQNEGISIKEWALANKYAPAYVYKILGGGVKGYFGKSAKIKHQLRKDFLTTTTESNQWN